MKTNNVLLNDSNAFIGDEVAAVENPLNKEENVSGETPLIEYENSIGEKCCGACSIHTKFSVTNKTVTSTFVQKHCGLILKDERITVPLDDVTSVSVSKAPYLWTYLGAGIVLAAGGGYLATKFMIPGVIVLVVGVVLLAIFAYYALFPVTRIFVSTKLTAPTLFTWAPLVLAFSYIYSGNDSTGAEVTIGSGEDTAGIILAPKKDEVELGRWTAEEKNSLQSLIVTNKRVAFRTYAKFLCVTSVEYLESIKPSEIQGLQLMTSPYVIERLYMGLLLVVVGAILFAQKVIAPILPSVVLGLGVICMASMFCGKLDRVVVYLKSTTPILCMFMNRSVVMQVPVGEGVNAYNLIRSEVSKYQEDYAAI